MKNKEFKIRKQDETQDAFILRVLKEREGLGWISRNEALHNHISKLSTLLSRMRKKGYIFKSHKVENVQPSGRQGYDYLYFLQQAPE